MLEPADILLALRNRGATFFTGVPDSLLKDFCGYVTAHAGEHRHVIAANEGAAVALAAGHHLATGELPVVYMQNSGLGNAVNPLLSLADRDVYALPMLLIIGWRGEPGVPDEPQHVKQGRVMLPMLDALEIPHRILSPEPEQAHADIRWAAERAREESRPVALLVRRGTFASSAQDDEVEAGLELSREDAIERVIAALDADDVVVSTTGMISREVWEIRKRRGDPFHDFLTVGSMGHASAIACGVAMARADRQVFCLDGDGAMLMHMGSLAVHGQIAGENFKHVLLNNGCHDSVGGQPTVATSVDLSSIARICGYIVPEPVTKAAAVSSAVRALRASRGPALLEIRVRKGARKDLGRPGASPLQNKDAFVRFVTVRQR